jgi:hypothetical protein
LRFGEEQPGNCPPGRAAARGLRRRSGAPLSAEIVLLSLIDAFVSCGACAKVSAERARMSAKRANPLCRTFSVTTCCSAFF